jgi:hypothetical protein
MVAGKLPEQAFGFLELVVPLDDILFVQDRDECFGFGFFEVESKVFGDQRTDSAGVAVGLGIPFAEDAFVRCLKARDVAKVLVGFVVAIAHAIEAGIGISMIAGDHHENVVVFGGHRDHGGNGVVESDLIAEQGADVIEVGGVVDAGAFDLQQEGFVAGEKTIERRLCHFRKARHRCGKRGIMIAVEGKGQVTFGKGAEKFRTFCSKQLAAIENHFVAGFFEIAREVSLVAALFGIKVARATAEDDIDAIQVLRRDELLVAAR